MSDAKTGDDASTGDAPQDGEAKRGKTMSLKRTVESGQVRQSFSHGRSKSVLVEKRRKRVVKPGQEEAQVAAPAEAPAAPAAPTPAAPKAPAMPEGLSKAEQDKRLAAVAEAKIRAVEEAKQAEIDNKRRAEEDEKRAEERAALDAEAVKQAEVNSRKAKKGDVVDPVDAPPAEPALVPRAVKQADRKSVV